MNEQEELHRAKQDLRIAAEDMPVVGFDTDHFAAARRRLNLAVDQYKDAMAAVERAQSNGCVVITDPLAEAIRRETRQHKRVLCYVVDTRFDQRQVFELVSWTWDGVLHTTWLEHPTRGDDDERLL